MTQTRESASPEQATERYNAMVADGKLELWTLRDMVKQVKGFKPTAAEKEMLDREAEKDAARGKAMANEPARQADVNTKARKATSGSSKSQCG